MAKITSGPPATGGGASPGVGDYMSADVNNGAAVPNGGSFVTVTFDDGVQGGGAGAVTLGVDQQTITLVSAGIYAISAYVVFDAADPTGDRAISFLQSGAVATAGPRGWVPNTLGGRSQILNSWTDAYHAGATLKVQVACIGAAGDTTYTYGWVSVAKLAPLGS